MLSVDHSPWKEVSQECNSYYGEGRVVSKQMLSSKAEDPIKTFWMWKPIDFEARRMMQAPRTSIHRGAHARCK